MTNREDDGRTVVNMNVEGMPWYQEGAEKRVASDLTWKELWAVYRAAMKAMMTVTLLFCGALVLFVLFCVKVWFR